MVKPKVTEINCQTGKQIVREMTDDELIAYQEVVEKYKEPVGE